jgi:transcriptional regulator with XRE-family HTH domain
MNEGKTLTMPRRSDPIDAHVGQRLKLQRAILGISQDKLGGAVGVSFQMIQKYENGVCRVGASRLMKLGQALGVPVSFFFEGFQTAGNAAQGMSLAEEKPTLDDAVFQSKETLELLKAYYALPEAMRKHFMGLLKGVEVQAPELTKDGIRRQH